MAPLDPKIAAGVSPTLPAGDTPVLVPPLVFKELMINGSDLVLLHCALSGMLSRLPAPPPEAPLGWHPAATPAFPVFPELFAGLPTMLELENLSEP